MKSKQMLVWFSRVSIILVLFGVLFAFFGLAILLVQLVGVLALFSIPLISSMQK